MCGSHVAQQADRIQLRSHLRQLRANRRRRQRVFHQALDLFLAGASRLGAPVANIKKDFWVCCTLDALYHRLPKDGPRLLFKGGTSLSKAYGLTFLAGSPAITVGPSNIAGSGTVQTVSSGSVDDVAKTKRTLPQPRLAQSVEIDADLILVAEIKHPPA